jgi:nucleosome assembly protein 1-like 1
MESDFEVGRTIADEIIPYSLEYYLGINPEHDDDECDDEDCDEDHDHDDDDEDDDNHKKVNSL